MENNYKQDDSSCTFDTGLKKGEYRLVSNAATGQIYQIALQNQPVSNKYQTKKAKAQTIKKGKTVRNIYTTSEKAARWYKVKATKKQSIKISTNNNSGKLEVSIYKKGRKKVLKKLSFKGEQSKTYRVKKGTYYVKTAKSGAKMNGEYTIRCKQPIITKVHGKRKMSINSFVILLLPIPMMFSALVQMVVCVFQKNHVWDYCSIFHS